jgi:hypothetical protein
MSLRKKVLSVLFSFSLIMAYMAYADELPGIGTDLFLDDLDAQLAAIQQYEDQHIDELTATRAVTPSQLALALSQIKEPLWKNTKPPAGRDILYLLPHKITAIEYGGIAANVFFNMTNDMKVTIHDTFSEPQIDRITNFLPAATPSFPISEEAIQQLLPLFKKLTIQERKFGVLFQGGLVRGPYTAQLNTSIQLGARNFWLSERDQRAIEDIIKNQYSSKSSGGGSVARPKFNDREMYIINIGLGDTRLKLGLNALNMTSLQIDVGIESIVPTSSFSSPTLKSGIPHVADYDGDANEEVMKHAVDVLRTIRDHLVSPRLGNGGHYGLGCYLESKIGMFHELVQLWARASYDVLFPGDEDRLFMFKKTMTPDDVLNSPSKEKNNTYVREYMLPSALSTSVCPGGVMNFVAEANINFTKRLIFALGYDFYAQQEEQIKKLHNAPVNIQSLLIEEAQLPSVYQHKVFSEVFYHNKKLKKDVGVGLGGDFTVASRHIGQDWTLYLKLAASF